MTVLTAWHAGTAPAPTSPSPPPLSPLLGRGRNCVNRAPTPSAYLLGQPGGRPGRTLEGERVCPLGALSCWQWGKDHLPVPTQASSAD